MTMGEGGTTEKALDWISQHDQDPDFHEELRVVGQAQGEKPVSKLTAEEKKQKAKELQEAIRKKRAEEDKRIAEEAEKNRVRIAKELTEAKRKMDEQQ